MKTTILCLLCLVCTVVAAAQDKAAPPEREQEQAAAESMREARIDRLNALAFDEKLTREQYREGVRLLGATKELSQVEQRRLVQFLHVIEGKLSPDELEKALAAAEAASASRADAPAERPFLATLLGAKRTGEVQEFAGDLKIKMCWCPPGDFTMGSAEGETDRERENQAEVTLTRGFWIGQTEVTQGQWRRVKMNQPWYRKEYVQTGDEFPAVYVNHGNDRGVPEPFSAQGFCIKLTELERLAARLPEGWAYRLPTEAEWEYACRAGTQTTYSFGPEAADLGAYAWFLDNAWGAGEKFAHQVGVKKPNPWSLHDMHGNVWEWCSDRFVDKPPGGRDPRGPSSGENRVIRGGGFKDDAGFARSDRRGPATSPKERTHAVGFRVVLGQTE